eukprot:4647272-Pleurochrysis_carterae.AAC.1
MAVSPALACAPCAVVCVEIARACMHALGYACTRELVWRVRIDELAVMAAMSTVSSMATPASTAAISLRVRA